MQKYLLILSFVCSLLNAQTIKVKPEFRKFFSENNVTGSFILLNDSTGDMTIFNEPQIDSGFITASTFKIFNSLLFLETGVVKDENEVTPWDSVVRNNPNWDKDQTMANAFRSSTVWYYQKYAREVGEEQMQHWINKADYGNKNIGGGIDRFWLNGEIRITPKEQVNFIRRLYHNQLPFSQRSMDIVKRIFIYKEFDGIVYRGKTGMSEMNNTDIGWWVGSITKGSNTWFFALCVQSKNPDNPKFIPCRIEIAEKILKDLSVLPK